MHTSGAVTRTDPSPPFIHTAPNAKNAKPAAATAAPAVNKKAETAAPAADKKKGKK